MTKYQTSAIEYLDQKEDQKVPFKELEKHIVYIYKIETCVELEILSKEIFELPYIYDIITIDGNNNFVISYPF